MLGELLEIMHTCTDRWTTLHADLHEWQDDDGLAAASQARSTSFGVTRSRPPGLPAGYGHGIDRGRLAVDRATGLILRLEAVHDGRPVRRVEVTDLVLDAAVDPSTFSVEPPAGSVPPDPAHHSSLPPAEAARHVPFTVFAPAASLGDYPWTAFVATGPNHPVRLYLHQIGTPLGRHLNRVSILQAADPAALPDVTRWSAVDLDGGPGHAWTEDAATDLVAWRDGTGIWIQNAADLDAARALLQSLRVVPRDGGPGTT
jgi:hypothetical protein